VRQVAVVEAFNRRSGASDIFTLELSDVIVNDTCASISQECFTEPTRRALGTEILMWSRSGRRAAEKGVESQPGRFMPHRVLRIVVSCLLRTVV